MFLKKYDIALEKFITLQKAYYKNGHKADLELCDLNIATAEYFLGNYKNAYFQYRKGIHSDDYKIRAKSFYGICLVNKKQGNIEQSIFFCDKAINEIEDFRNMILKDDLRFSYLSTFYDYYYEMIDLYLSKNDFSHALEYLERLKCRSLAETLANRGLLPNNASIEEKKEFKQLRLKICSISAALKQEKKLEKRELINEKLNILLNQYSDFIEHLKNKYSGFEFNNAKLNSYFEIEKVTVENNQAIIELFPMENKIAVFIIRKNVPLEHSSVIINTYNRSQLKNSIFSYIDNYLKHRSYSKSISIDSEINWSHHLEKALEELYKEIFLKIETKLEGIDNIVVIPYGLLHFIPFHAMFLNSNDKRKYLIEDYLISYAPSLNVLKTCMTRKRIIGKNVIIAYSNPINDSIKLPYALSEVNEIQQMFSGSTVLNNATKSKLKKYSKNSTIFHYAGHAHHRGLIVHNEEDQNSTDEYNVEDIFEDFDLTDNSLVTLSACETGMIIPKGPDEYFGIAGAFISAGAESVISSLWSVPDISTSLLMKKMYSLVIEGYGKAEALRAAQLWLKNYKPDENDNTLTRPGDNAVDYCNHERGFQVQSNDWEETMPSDYSNPYHWAGFFCTGAP